MHFMVIETYRFGPGPVYDRLAAAGRQIPEGITFVDSWIDEDLTRCWQVMDADRREDLDSWLAAWSDLVSFDVIPVVSSYEARRRALGT